ncbi:MAG: DUF2757 family protein [Thermoflavifilum sp.]|nr:DUF2757 family protein [Thermoflavifilum sp.]MCL6513749.1 anti-sigma-F factor Fin family protein [Alicyclobacillus sp.]
MRVSYVCRYCNHMVGELNRPDWTLHDAEWRLGLASLSPVERSEWISYNEGSETLTVQTVCDWCQRAVETHPELLVEGNPLQ